MKVDKYKNFEIVIKPNRDWFYIDFRSLWDYRDLLFLLVRRDFLSKYKQTILGPLWSAIQPLITTIVFTLIFGKMIKIPTQGLPPVLFYLSGLVIWQYFSKTTMINANTFIDNAHLFGKVYFPRLIIPLSVTISNLFNLIIHLIIFFGFYIYFKYFSSIRYFLEPNLFIFMFPIIIFLTAALSLAVGLWISALTARYRDLKFLMEFIIQMWMYLTPVIYPASLIMDKWKALFIFNPMAALVETFRYSLLGVGLLNFGYLFISLIITLILLFSGILIFNKVERTFIDSI